MGNRYQAGMQNGGIATGKRSLVCNGSAVKTFGGICNHNVDRSLLRSADLRCLGYDSR